MHLPFELMLIDGLLGTVVQISIDTFINLYFNGEFLCTMLPPITYQNAPVFNKLLSLMQGGKGVFNDSHDNASLKYGHVCQKLRERRIFFSRRKTWNYHNLPNFILTTRIRMNILH